MHRLYYDPAIPLSELAPQFGVPVSTFLRWIGEMGWPRHRACAGACIAGPPLPEPARPARPDAPREVISVDEAAEAVMAFDEMRREVGASARLQLAALRHAGPMTLAERERAARIMASLSRTIERIERAEYQRLRTLALAQVHAERDMPSAEDEAVAGIHAALLERLRRVGDKMLAPLKPQAG